MPLIRDDVQGGLKKKRPLPPEHRVLLDRAAAIHAEQKGGFDQYDAYRNAVAQNVRDQTPPAQARKNLRAAGARPDIQVAKPQHGVDLGLLGLVNQAAGLALGAPPTEIAKNVASYRHPGQVYESLQKKQGPSGGTVFPRGFGRKAAPEIPTPAPPVVFHDMTPEQQLSSVFRDLARARAKQDAGYSAARGKVASKLKAIHADPALTPQEKMAAASQAMRGELPKVIVDGEAREMTQDTLNHLLGTVFSHPNLGEFRKHDIADALTKLIHEGTTPQPAQLTLMRHIWGKDIVGSIKEAASTWTTWKNHALSVLNIPRAIESTLDQSFGLRQGLVAAAYDPKNWWKNYSHSFSYLSKYTGSGEAGYKHLVEDIHADPNFPRFQEGGLALTDLEHDVGIREEPYQSNLAEKLTYKGHGPGNAIRGSGRGYTGAALGMRRDIANRLLDLSQSKGYNIDDEKNLHDIMSFVNAITGRGNLPGKVLKESAPLLNALFFSPRLLGSRLQMLGQPANMALLRRNPLIYRQYLKANAKTFGTLGIVLASVRMFVPGASVNMNPRSSDFGKIKVGDTRIDLGGGFNQVLHQAGEQITGEKISSTTGELHSLKHPEFGQPSRFDEFLNFLKGKESPSAGILTDYLSNNNSQHFGQPFNWVDEAKAKLVPLSLQDAQSMSSGQKGVKSVLAGLSAYGLSGVGVGVQNYAMKADADYKDNIKTIDRAVKAGQISAEDAAQAKHDLQRVHYLQTHDSKENRRQFVIDEMHGQSKSDINAALHQLGYDPLP